MKTKNETVRKVWIAVTTLDGILLDRIQVKIKPDTRALVVCEGTAETASIRTWVGDMVIGKEPAA